MERTDTDPPRWAWACVAAWIALWMLSPTPPHLLGRPDPTGELETDSMLLLTSLPALVLGGALAYRRAWPAFLAAVAGALGSCPVVGVLLADLDGDGVALPLATFVAAYLGLFFGVLPLSVGAFAVSTVRRVHAGRTAGSH
ncbi:hypothetical protein ACGFX4_02445 [Kitasatospora sp. NPDC048365]|uniref:hypothetical protein n=1 Tax=Kitasatospora sp. NPDC048365 TaxID=3364050 RepID=UPI003714B94A